MNMQGAEQRQRVVCRGRREGEVEGGDGRGLWGGGWCRRRWPRPWLLARRCPPPCRGSRTGGPVGGGKWSSFLARRTLVIEMCEIAVRGRLSCLSEHRADSSARKRLPIPALARLPAPELPPS